MSALNTLLANTLAFRSLSREDQYREIGLTLDAMRRLVAEDVDNDVTIDQNELLKQLRSDLAGARNLAHDIQSAFGRETARKTIEEAKKYLDLTSGKT